MVLVLQPVHVTLVPYQMLLDRRQVVVSDQVLVVVSDLVLVGSDRVLGVSDRVLGRELVRVKVRSDTALDRTRVLASGQSLATWERVLVMPMSDWMLLLLIRV